jgi:hypothetical protein
LIASSQKHALVLSVTPELHLAGSQLSTEVGNLYTCSLDHTSEAVARGPPSIA